MGPINYLAAMPQVDFAGDLQTGLQLGQQFQQRRLDIEKKQAAMEAARQYQLDIEAVSKNPSAKAYADLALKYPQQREAYKQAWEQLDAGQRKAQGEAALQTAFALESGNPNAAKKVIQSRITALENSGEDASHEKLILGAIDANPTAVRGELLRWAAYTQDPEKFAENFGKLGQEQRAQEVQPDAVREAGAKADGAVADATTKSVQAKYADQGALLDLEKKGWDIKALQADIDYKKQSTRIAAMNAAYNRESNDLKRQELQQKINTAKVDLDNKLRDRADEARTQIDGAKAVTTLIDEIFADNDSLEAASGASAWRAKIPGTKARTISGKIEQVSNTLALLNIDKLKGPTSDRDILFLKQIAANLDRYQNEDALKRDLGRVRDITVKREEQLRKKYGVPATQEDPATKPRNVVVDY